ncbi:MAG: DHA2 family efflux MFS transporter permease subunit [Thermoleophilia bacterium]
MAGRSLMTTEMTASERAYSRRWLILAVLVLCVLVIGLDNMVLNVAIPTLQSELGASSSQLIWMIDAYIVVFASLLLVAGSLSDRFGRRRAMLFGLVVFGLASLAAAYASGPIQLIIARAVMGAGAAFLATASLSIVSNVFPQEERGRAIGVWAGFNALGIAAGPVIGGVLLEHFWWGSAFLVNLPVVGIALVASAILLVESRDPSVHPLDLPGLALSAVAVSALIYGLIEASSRGWTNGVILLCFAAAAISGAGFIVREMRTRDPMLQLQFFRNHRFTMGVVAAGVASFALFGLTFSLTQLLQFVQGYTPLQAGLRLVPVSLGILVGAGNANRLVRRYGTARVIASGLIVLSVSLGSIVLWAPATSYWVIGSTLFVLALGMGSVMAPAVDAIMGGVPESKAGVGSAMNSVTRMIAGAFGAAIIGSVMYSIYGAKVSEVVTVLPPDLAQRAQDSVGAATQIAASLPPEAGAQLSQATGAAFADAMGLAALIGAAVALIGAPMVLGFMPAHHLPAESTQIALTGDGDVSESVSRGPT